MSANKLLGGRSGPEPLRGGERRVNRYADIANGKGRIVALARRRCIEGALNRCRKGAIYKQLIKVAIGGTVASASGPLRARLLAD